MSDEPATNATTTDRAPALVWWLGFAFIVLGVAAVFWAIPQQQDDLSARSEQAVARAGYTGIDVEFAGRDAVLHGAVETTQDVAELEAVVRGVRGVRVVDVSDVTLAEGGEG